MSFADNLQYLRRKNKITQEQLAEELGVSRQSVSKWETGEAYPETEKLIVLCEKFGVTLDGLLRGDVSGGSEEKEESAPCEEDAPQDIKEECAPPIIQEENEDSDGEAVKEQADDGDEKAVRRRWNEFLRRLISSVTVFLCAVVYLCVGLAFNLWHPAWLIFLGGVIICIWTGCLTESSKQMKERIGDAVCGSSMIAAVIIYLSLGFTLGIWHPTWVVFIVAVGVCAVVGTVTGKHK